MTKKYLLFRNCLGGAPGKGREYRLVDQETFRTVELYITDDCGSGARQFPNAGNWIYLSNAKETVRNRYRMEMQRRLARMENYDKDEAITDLNERVFGFRTDEYPVTLRGCDLDKSAEVFDRRYYHKPEGE